MDDDAACDFANRYFPNALQITQRFHKRLGPLSCIFKCWHTDANSTIALMDKAVQFIPRLLAYTYYKP